MGRECVEGLAEASASESRRELEQLRVPTLVAFTQTKDAAIVARIRSSGPDAPSHWTW